MTTKEKIVVMQAYVDGKQIQYRSKIEETWVNVRKDFGLSWDWITFDYRIKPEPKEPTCRPYKDFAEFRKDWEKHGGWANDKCNSNRRLIEVYNDEFADTLLTYYTWTDDGSPCGVLVEEGGDYGK